MHKRQIACLSAAAAVVALHLIVPALALAQAGRVGDTQIAMTYPIGRWPDVEYRLEQSGLPRHPWIRRQRPRRVSATRRHAVHGCVHHHAGDERDDEPRLLRRRSEHVPRDVGAGAEQHQGPAAALRRPADRCFSATSLSSTRPGSSPPKPRRPARTRRTRIASW